ncbi:MAG: polysialyltransferase family glycosyltransferase [Scytonema sp. PMC 1070.18]|nr:polysialyltransferase family glycosyltransferase [Scytonema sp. PMC 1070.18]
MMNRKLIKRVITCQGTIQLVTALSVLAHREREQQHLGYQYENYLVIYELYAPSEQVDEFVVLIKKMAELVSDWKAIVYISPEELKNIEIKLKTTGYSKIFKIVHELVGIDSPNEIYLCRNWQFGNKLLINTYRSAEKICYGDSIGIYFSQNSPVISPVPKISKTPLLHHVIQDKIVGLIRNIKHYLKLKTVLKDIDFNIGYFILPNILGEKPPMKVITTDKLSLLEKFHKMRCLVELEYVDYLCYKIGNAPVSVLLTSNLSEADRMSMDNEIAAYKKFLMTEKIDPDSVLVLKPHPRDSEVKIRKLENTLADLYTEVVTLSKQNLFFLPFEVFFMAAFLNSDLTFTNKLRVFAVSSACLSLSLLFNVPCVVGFGEQITSSTFYENYVGSRLQHEQDLRVAIDAIKDK